MKLLLLILLIATFPIGLKAQAQETHVEKADSSSYEMIRLRARESIQQFIDYYKLIADKSKDLSQRMRYVKKASELFLPEQGIIISTQTFLKSKTKRTREQKVKVFLENVARGLYNGIPSIDSYEFCHFQSQKPFSETETEVTFCSHGDTLRNRGNICIMPNGYVTSVIPTSEEGSLSSTYLTKVHIDFVNY
jgi:hypothetical protein